MRLKRAIKRIVALGTGATMVGATILGAMAAADLSQYPKPLFVEDGAFNGLIVVGKAAMPEDVLGSIDIASSLQYSTTVEKTVPGTGTTVEVVGEGVKVETSSNKLTIGESLKSVKTNLDEDDLPLLLAKGTYVNDGDDESSEYAYSQKLEFGPSRNASVSFIKDGDYVDEDNPYVLLYGPKSSGSGTSKTWFMRYTLDFTKNPDSDCYTGTTCGTANEMCDFEDTKVEIMGIEYEVTKAEWDNSAKLTWEMMGGVSLNTMYEGETKTFTVSGVDYEVTVDIISDTGSAAESVILTVNGVSSKELFKDQTQNIAGIEVGIKQVMGNEAGEAGAGRDLVQFYLGAQKMVFTDDDTSTTLDSNVKVSGSDIDDLYVDWTVVDGSDSVKVDRLELTWVPSDKVFVSEDQTVSLPGLESYDLVFKGLTSEGNEEVVKIKPHGNDKMELTIPLEAGAATFDIFYSSDAANYTNMGKSATAGNERLIVAAGSVTVGDHIVLSDATERESHVVELDRIDSKNITRLKNLANGDLYEGDCTGGCTISVGDTDAVFNSVNTNADTISINNTATGADIASALYTKEGLKLELGTSASSTSEELLVFTEEDENGALAAGDSWNVTLGFTSGKTTVSGVEQSSPGIFTNATGSTDESYEYEDTEDYAYMTPFGTRIVWDKSGDQETVEVYYPGEESHANVFVNSEAAVITEGGGGGVYDEVQKIEVGFAVLDTDVDSLTADNTIVVGGPCVNNLAAELMGNPADCAEGFEMGKAMIKLYEHENGNVALLVAGYSAMDTRRASRVVANYDQYENFAGTELEVTGTSLTDISVGVPAPVEEVVEEEVVEEEAAE